jgi:hypothetical protein
MSLHFSENWKGQWTILTTPELDFSSGDFQRAAVYGVPADVFESSGASPGAAGRLSAVERYAAAGNVWAERG